MRRQRKLSARGSRFYSEDTDSDYEVEHYEIQTHIDPRREWIDGRVELRARVRSVAMGTLTLRLAESLVPRSIFSPGMGRLLSLRVKGQNSVVVNLTRTLSRGDAFTLIVTYSGRLPGVTPEREVLQQQGQEVREEVALVAEPRTTYSHRSYWYPQTPVSDYATATIRVIVPENMACVATGVAAAGNPVRVDGVRPGESGRLYAFIVDKPARYFATIVTRLDFAASGVAAKGGVPFVIQANPRQVGRGRALTEPTARVFSVYADLLGPPPYPHFTLTLVDDPLPGGHSPAYFAILHQPLPTTPFSWRNDPVSFESFPQFFLAHEIAHQFWGNAVGWENYHEQWISEGFAQYLAVLYAERTRPREDLESILRKLRQTALANSRHGPVWLGYRLGHLQEDGRIFRAVVYNKSAIVLHMLRRWLGDEVFFRALRRLFRESVFTKIGTRHVQRIFEEESDQPLDALLRALDSGGPDADDPRAASRGGRDAAGDLVDDDDGPARAGGDRTDQRRPGRGRRLDEPRRRHPRAARRRLRPAGDGDAAVCVGSERGRAGEIVGGDDRSAVPAARRAAQRRGEPGLGRARQRRTLSLVLSPEPRH